MGMTIIDVFFCKCLCDAFTTAIIGNMLWNSVQSNWMEKTFQHWKKNLKLEKYFSYTFECKAFGTYYIVIYLHETIIKRGKTSKIK